MNTRFLLKFLTASKRNTGFAMPMVIMAGLVIVVAGVAIMIKGMNDQNQVTSKALSQQAEALAEAGAVQYTDFLNKHPKLAIRNNVPDNNEWQTAWTTFYSGSSSSASSSSSSAGTAPPQSGATCRTTTYNSAGNPTTPGAGGTSSIPSNQVSNWIVPGNVRTVGNGKVSLVGYAYDGTKNVGAIAVQGIIGEDSGNQAKSQIQYAFKVRPESTGASTNVPIIPQLAGGAPGLWARSFNTGAIAYANVLDSSGCATGTPNAFDSSVGNLPQFPITALPNGNHTPDLSSTPASITRQEIPFPPLPSYPSASDPNTGTVTNDNFPDLVTQHKVNQLTDCSRTQYPATGDYDSEGNPYSSTATGPKTYRYRITGSCTPPSGAQFGTTGRGDESIVVYVDSTFTSSNNGRVASNGTSNAKVIWLLKTSGLNYGGNAQIGSSSALTAENWAFFLYNPSATLGLQGTSDIYAFIFAPYSSASLGGNPKVAGGLWVNSFSTNGNPPKIFQSITQAGVNALFTAAYNASGDTAYASTPGQPIPAKIELIGNYTTQAVDTPVAVPASLDYSTAYASSASSVASSSSSQASSSSSQASSSSSQASNSSSSSVASSTPYCIDWQNKNKCNQWSN